jgi:hypothetical protein
MDLIKFDVKGPDGSHKVVLECDARGTRNGFAHDATLIIDGVRQHTSTCHYLNRTWEWYRYQTVCLTCCNEMLDGIKDRIKRAYRKKHGLSRICGDKRKMEVKEIIDSDLMAILLREIKEILKERCF